VVLTVSKGPEPVPQEAPKPPVEVGPVTGGEPDTSDGEAPRRQWEVIVRVPEQPDHPQNVRIDVQDEDGTTHEEYSDDQQPGEEIRPVVQGVGHKGKVKIRVFVDGRKVREQSE